MLKKLFLHFEETLGAILLAVMVTISFANVLTRYFFKYSMAFTEELVVYLFVWVILLGTSMAFREGSHMAVTAFYSKVNKKIRKPIFILGYLLSAVFFLALLYYGSLEVITEYQMEAKTEAISLPIWLFTGAMPVVSFCILIRLFFRLRKDLSDANY